MFGAHVLYLFRKFLGKFEGLFEALCVWKGFVIYRDLSLTAEVLSCLNLPVTVKAVFIDTITLQVPWKNLGILQIDNIFLLAEPAPDGHTPKDKDKEKLFIEGPCERSWFCSLIAYIYGGFEVTINNVHIRYEDSISKPGHPFCSGVTLSKFVVTSDEQDNETFDASGALEKLHESLQLLRLAVYHDSESAPWTVGKSWEDLNFADWAKIFQDGIDEQLDGNRTVSLWAEDLRYLVFPKNGAVKYYPLGNLEWKASFVLSDVYVTVSEAQYYWSIKLLEALSTCKTRVEVSHLRPDVPVLEDTRAWWRFAMFASLQQKKRWLLTHAKVESAGAMIRTLRSLRWLLGPILVFTMVGLIAIYLALGLLFARALMVGANRVVGICLLSISWCFVFLNI